MNLNDKKYLVGGGYKTQRKEESRISTKGS